MTKPIIDLSFPHPWHAEILAARPLILPTRHFVYPQQVEEVERGALEILVQPHTDSAESQPFLATCALGFRDPVVPTGLWSTPEANTLCAVSGGYAFMIDTQAPQRFTMLPYRPVLRIEPVPAHNLLLFVGHQRILAWGASGHAWESEKLSDEGVTITGVEQDILHGIGWNMMTDLETPFALNLRLGRLQSSMASEK